MNRRDHHPKSSTERLPYKPTRESSRRTGDPAEALDQRSEPAGLDNPRRLGKARQHERKQEPTRPPHLTPQDHDAEFQQNHISPEDVAALPANASGVDKMSSADQTEDIDEESMYDRRPERDKERPPSRRARRESD